MAVPNALLDRMVAFLISRDDRETEVQKALDARVGFVEDPSNPGLFLR